MYVAKQYHENSSASCYSYYECANQNETMYESCLLFENETLMYETKAFFEKMGEKLVLQRLKLNVSLFTFPKTSFCKSFSNFCNS